MSFQNYEIINGKIRKSFDKLKAGGRYIELHGNHYGDDLGYKPSETRKMLSGYGIKTSGVCGMFSEDNDLSSNRAVHRQAAIDYLRREIVYASERKAATFF